MKSRIRTHKKRTREQIQDTTAQAKPMFQTRPFVVQSQTAQKSQLPDLKTSLMRAERYGHHLSRINPAGVPAATAIQQKMARGKPEQSDRGEAIEVIKSQQLVGTPEHKTERKVDELAVQEGGREVGSGESASGTELAKSQYVVQRARNRIVDNPNDPQNTTNPGTGKGLLKDSTDQISNRVKFGPLRNDCGTSVKASIRPNDDLSGSSPGTNRPGWWAAQTAGRTGVRDFWVMGHLLNDKVGGPGQMRNLTPITKKANRLHELLVESFVKGEVLDTGNSVDYKVVAQYNGAGPAWLQTEEGNPTTQGRNPAPAAWPNLPTALDCYYKAKRPNGQVVGKMKRTIKNEHA